MANIQLTWDATAMASASDIENLHIFTIDGDQSSTYPQTNGQVDATAAATFAAAGTAVTQILSKTANSYVHQNVTNPGSGKTWGVFSYNSAGYGPGSVFHFSGYS